MRTPVSRFEKIAAYFILLATVPLLALVIVPGVKPGGFLNRNHLVFDVLADSGLDLTAGDKVTMSGIQIGKVDSLELQEDNRVRITCSVYEQYSNKVTTEAVVVVIPPPVVGSAKIDIRPGGGQPLRLVGKRVTIEAQLEPSIEDRANGILVEVESVIRNANARVEEMQRTLLALQAVLDQVNAGKGTLGQFIYGDEFYERLSQLVTKLENAASTV